jgi:uroporphyrinogen-III synthase
MPGRRPEITLYSEYDGNLEGRAWRAVYMLLVFRSSEVTLATVVPMYAFRDRSACTSGHFGKHPTLYGRRAGNLPFPCKTLRRLPPSPFAMTPSKTPAFALPWTVPGIRRPRVFVSSRTNGAAGDGLAGARALPPAFCAPCMRVSYVALTREAEKNEALRAALASAMPEVSCIALPCVETVPGPDAGALVPALRGSRYDWVVITSPEAASIFCTAWEAAGRPTVRVATVGAATSQTLGASGVEVAFVPSKATGRALVDEILPAKAGNGRSSTVLYPASLLATSTVPHGLAGKGYVVERLNTYSTRMTEWSDGELSDVERVDIVTFAAPSAVKSWVKKAGVDASKRVACIGETSAAAARNFGFDGSNVFYPEKPGLSGWVEAVAKAVAAE